MSKIFPVILLLFLSPQLWCEEKYLLFPEEAVRKGLANNPALEFGRRELETGMKNIRLEYRKFLPEPNFGYSFSDSVSYLGNDSHVRQLRFGIDQLLYDKGALFSEIYLGKKKIELGYLELAAERERFIFSVIEGYAEILRYRKELEIIASAVNLVNEQLEIGRLERDLGELTENDYLELEISASDMRMEENEVRHRLKQASEALRLLIDPGMGDFTAAGELNAAYRGFTDEGPEFYLASALKRSSEYRSVILALEQAEADCRLLKKRFVPEVRLSCGFYLSGKSFPLAEKGYSLSVSFDFDSPVFPGNISSGISRNGGNNRERELEGSGVLLGESGKIHAAETGQIRLERAEHESEQYRLELENEINGLLEEIRMKKVNLSLWGEKLVIERKKTEAEKARTELGEARRTEYVEELIELAESEKEMLKQVTGLYSAEKRLVLLCGLEKGVGSIRLLIKGDGL